jgi:hypothetical protein
VSNVTIKIGTVTDAGPVKALGADMRALEKDTIGLGAAFVKFNQGLELTNKVIRIVDAAAGALPRTLLAASEAAAGNKRFMEGLAEAHKRVEMSIGKLVNESGVLVDFLEGTTQIADTLSKAINGISIESEGFRDAMQNLVIPAIQLVVGMSAAAIGGAAELAKRAFTSTAEVALRWTAVMSVLPGMGDTAKSAANIAGDLITYAKSFDEIGKAAGRAAVAVQDAEIKFSGGRGVTTLPEQVISVRKPRAAAAAASPYTREGEDARGAVDAFNARNEALAKAQADHDRRVADLTFAFEASVADERYARRQNEADRLLQIEIAAEEERLRFSQGVQQQISGFAQGTFDELGRGFARLVTTGKFGAKEFGAAMLGMTGQQAAARGALWLGEGLAMLFAGNPAGAAVAAQGAGLITLGGTLGGLASAMGAKGAGAGAAAPSYVANDVGPRRRDEERESVIVINVNTGGGTDLEDAYHASVLRRLLERGAVTSAGTRVNV